MNLLSYQPIKAAYVLAAAAYEAAKLPFWVLKFAFRSGRPHPQWTFKQALMVHISRAFLTVVSNIEMRVPLSLKPGAEKDRFITMPPSSSTLYTGPMLLSPDKIKPTTIGGTWYPRLPSASDLQTSPTIVLHFHGGAYTLGDGRKADCSFAAKNLLAHAQASFIFCPQYRLASYPSLVPFPGALQDALTSYLHLLRVLDVPASRIVVSGDSAGANLALALLRYLAAFGDRLQVPKPGAAWLWSPWVALQTAVTKEDVRRIDGMALAKTDYVCGTFARWGACAYVPKELLREGASEELLGYVSPLGRPFNTGGVPVWVSVGEVEILVGDGLKLAEEMRSVGNEVEVDVQKAAAHDYLLVGYMIGMEANAEDAARKAGEWVRKVRGGSAKL